MAFEFMTTSETPRSDLPVQTDNDENSVSAILVNWRTPEETLAAVAALRNQGPELRRIYVVDNGSRDDSVPRLRQGLADQSLAILMTSQENLGFGGGCNIALASALNDGCKYVWLLNSDAKPEPGALTALLAKAKRLGGTAGMVGSCMFDPDHPHNDHAGNWMHPWRLNGGWVRTDRDISSHRYAWVTAASVLLSNDGLRRVGLFDPEYFMYWEDADLAMRLRLAGFAIAIAQAARVEHRAGTSSASIPVQRYLWHYRSQRRFITKYHQSPAIAVLLLRLKFLAKALLDRDWPRLRALSFE